MPEQYSPLFTPQSFYESYFNWIKSRGVVPKTFCFGNYVQHFAADKIKCICESKLLQDFPFDGINKWFLHINDSIVVSTNRFYNYENNFIVNDQNLNNSNCTNSTNGALGSINNHSNCSILGKSVHEKLLDFLIKSINCKELEIQCIPSSKFFLLQLRNYYGNLLVLKLRNFKVPDRDMSLTDLTLVSIITNASARLTELSVTNSDITDISGAAITTTCKYLQKLQLKGCINLTDTTFTGTVESCYKTLSKIDFSGCERLTNKTLAAIGSLCSRTPDLEYFNSSVERDGFSTVQDAHPSFFIAGDPISRTTSKFATDTVNVIESRPIALEELYIGGCVNLTAESFSKLAKNCCSDLKTLDLDCANISDQFLQEIMRTCGVYRKLERLNVHLCDQIATDGIYTAIEYNYHTLISLALGGNRNFCDASLMLIVDYCYQLKSLNVSYCQGITDEGIIYLAERFGRCRDIASDGESRTNSADISRKTISENGGQSFSARSARNRRVILPNAVQMRNKVFNTLIMRFCQGLTEKSIKTLAKHCRKQMKQLHLYGCTSLKNITESFLLENFPCLISFSCTQRKITNPKFFNGF